MTSPGMRRLMAVVPLFLAALTGVAAEPARAPTPFAASLSAPAPGYAAPISLMETEMAVKEF